MSRSRSRSSVQVKKNGKHGGRSYFALYAVLGGFVLVAGALFAIWKSSQPEKATVPVEVAWQARLKVDQDRLDFGDVKLGQTVTASFILSNVGDKPLRITDKPYIQVLEGC